jgi:hypothetical protein
MKKLSFLSFILKLKLKRKIKHILDLCDFNNNYYFQTKNLFLHKKNIFNIPEDIYILEELELLDLRHNNISKLEKDFINLINLRTLYLSHNKIGFINLNIEFPNNLVKLDLSNNKILTVPKSIFNLNSLDTLDLSNNQLLQIPNDISNLVKLKFFHANYNQLRYIPDSIKELKNLIILSLSNNQIQNIPSSIGELTNIRKIIANNNFLKTLPSSLTKLTLCRFDFDNNPIEYLPPNLYRFLYKNPMKNIYNDKQNVHNINIQKCVQNSIFNLMNDKINNYYCYDLIEEIMLSTLDKEAKNIIVNYLLDKTLHSILQVTFEEVFIRIWNRIKKNENKDEIFKILNCEILDMKNKCFTGRITKTINVLSGYYDDININISENEQLSNIIIYIFNKYKKEDALQKIYLELKERGYGEQIINEWTEYADLYY